jgi:hypothetical protein
MANTTAYWQGLIDEFDVAMAGKAIEAFFISSVENRNNMRTTYTNLANNAPKFREWLVAMRDNASSGRGEGVMSFLTFGVVSGGRF